ncbi:Rrf2 family transcriptional regulator [Ensifer canadensis]
MLIRKFWTSTGTSGSGFCKTADQDWQYKKIVRAKLGLESRHRSQLAANLRLLAHLNWVGLATSQFGNGGGLWLARPRDRIILLEVCQAGDEEPLDFDMHEQLNLTCAGGRNINTVLKIRVLDVQAALGSFGTHHRCRVRIRQHHTGCFPATIDAVTLRLYVSAIDTYSIVARAGSY